MKTFMFLDLETTGLDPDDDRVLEIAWVFTDEHFVPIAEARSYVVDVSDDWSAVISKLRDNDYVRGMHTDSGLWADLATKGVTKDYAIRNRMYKDIEAQAAIGADICLAGFSVHFDKSMLEGDAFDAEWSLEGSGLHHRILDLSSIKVMLEITGIPYQKAKNAGAHRALNDVFESIEQARIFKALFGQLPVA